MIYPADYVQTLTREHIRPEDRRVMARVGLNVLVDPALYPVDLSEIRRTRCEARLLINALLAYMATNPCEYGSWEKSRCGALFGALKIADEKSENDGAHPCT